MFIDEVHTALLPCAADLVTAFDEASINLVAPVAFRCGDRIVILGDVQRQEMLCGEVSVAFQTSIYMRLGVVDFIFLIRCETKGLMRREATMDPDGLLFGCCM